jgi:membrane associated rhomboid family serine protease
MLILVPTQVDDGSQRGQIPTANALIVALNVILFFCGMHAPVGPGSGLFSLVGYSFTHAGVAHLVVNMWTLLIVGNAVNRRIGNAYYLLCYFGAVATLGLLARCMAGSYLVGSSGGVFAVIAVLAMLLPAAWAHVGYVAVFPLTLLVGLLLRPTHWLYWFIRWDVIRVRAAWALVLIPVLQLAGLFWWHWNWTNLAHLMGFVCGIAFVTLLPERVSMPRRVRYPI